ncbi:transcriptional regulator [Mesonia aestuariivivens]|uniref:Transcriptional regulator n=1 Tax=Mesonia aestuariivivens TaxID=2796128 RepID=A0ABS6VYD1_9FLAO|nr:transcriptional regulator [Mesonia aestuariivivens]MBW2960592.1 transcriptional regulator [Mesonia aestuariivivens]
MISIITGDIINSQSIKLPKAYLAQIRATLQVLGEEQTDWEIFRGDSFQIEIKDPLDAFWKCVYIKACLKTHKDLDARMAIGIGEKTYSAKNISEANGSAFIRSGDVFEKLKREKSNLLINTAKSSLDFELNVYFQLTLLAMDHWTTNSAEIVKLSIENPEMNQQQLGELIGIKQNTVSERQKRAALSQLEDFDLIFREKIIKLL